MSKSVSKYSSSKFNNSHEFGHLSDTFHSFDPSVTDIGQKNRKMNSGRLSLFNTVNERRGSKRLSKCRRRSLVGVSIMDMKNIEESTKNKILEMKYHVQIEMGRKYGDTLLEQFLNSSTISKENNEINSNSDINRNNRNTNVNSNKAIEKNMTNKNNKKENKDGNNENLFIKFATKYFDKEQEKEYISKIERKIGFSSLSTFIYGKNINFTNLNDSVDSKDKKKEVGNKKRNTTFAETIFKLKKANKQKWNHSATIRAPENFKSFFQGKIKYFNEQFRKLTLKKIIWDSQEDDETDEEKEVPLFVINPESNFILYFDIIIFICILYTVFYTPIKLAMSN